MKKPLLVLVLMLAAVLPAAAQDATPTDPAEDPCFQHNGTLNAETGQCQNRMNIDISMDYPLELVGYPFILDAVDTLYAQTRVQFLNFAAESGFSPSPVYQWALDMSYEITAQTDSLLSVVFYDYEFTGGAHGNTYVHTLNFDLTAKNVIALADLFADGVVPYDTIASISATTLEERLGADGTFPEGYTADPLNFQFWILAPDGLTFYFPPYQVAPYAAGIQTVTIPLDALGLTDLPYVTGGA